MASLGRPDGGGADQLEWRPSPGPPRRRCGGQITAKRLVRHIERSGSVATSQPASPALRVPGVAGTMSAGSGARVVLALAYLGLIAPLEAWGAWYLWRPLAGLICSDRGLHSAPLHNQHVTGVPRHSLATSRATASRFKSWTPNSLPEPGGLGRTVRSGHPVGMMLIGGALYLERREAPAATTKIDSGVIPFRCNRWNLTVPPGLGRTGCRWVLRLSARTERTGRR